MLEELKSQDPSFENEQSTEDLSENEKTEAPHSLENEKINRDSIRYVMESYTANFDLESLVKRYENGRISVPKYQRRFIWTKDMSSLFIDSLLKGLPVPPLLLYETKPNFFQVIDGQQRLLSIFYFFKKKFPSLSEKIQSKTYKELNDDPTAQIFMLSGQVHPALSGKTFDDLGPEMQEDLNNTFIYSVIFKQVDPKDSKSTYEVFERINTGSVKLSAQEVRMCSSEGTLSLFLEKFTNSSVWQNSQFRQYFKPTRGEDLEIILRILALSNTWKKYTQPFNTFLSNYMGESKNMDADDIGKFEKKLNQTISILTEIQIDKFKPRGAFNASFFEAVAIATIKAQEYNPKITVQDVRLKIEELRDPKDMCTKRRYHQFFYREGVSYSMADPRLLKNRIALALSVFCPKHSELEGYTFPNIENTDE